MKKTESRTNFYENNPEEIHDTIIIGGGIVGAGLFREQSLHKLSVLLLDQADFNSQTSQGSSKMLHGGIRYLENFDFSLVFEALKEKNLWLKLTPHITKEIPFYLPVYKESKWPLFFMRIGLFIYDALSLFKNSPYKVLNKKNTLSAMPTLKSKDLKGCGMYFDGIVDDAKLGLECIYDGLNNERSSALNYQKVIDIKELDHTGVLIYQVTFKDVLNNKIRIAKSRHICMATGPFTDQVMKELKIDWDPVIMASKGTHLWLKQTALPIKDAMVLQTKDKRIIFVIPQRNSILVGTTEDAIDEDEEILNIQATPKEIDYLIDVVNEYFPTSPITHQDVLSSFAAIRPLVREGSSSAKTSRHHKMFTPKKNMHVLVGGKYTTFRKMAQDLNKKIFQELGIKHNIGLTLNPLKTTSVINNPHETKITLEMIQNIIETEHIRTKEDLISRRLSLPSMNHITDLELIKILDQCEIE